MIRYNPNINEGLNSNQVQYRIKNNYVNKIKVNKQKSILNIIIDNTFTLFNLLNLYVAVLFIICNSYKSIIFISVIVINSIICIINDLITRKTINKIIDNKKIMVDVTRDSKNIVLESSNLVLDDITHYHANSIIGADSIILDGSVVVDEASLSGKEKLVVKNINDTIYAKSKIVSGKCIARVDKVGNNNYIYKLMNIVKYKNTNSYIKSFINNIVKYVSIITLILSIIIYMQTKSINRVVNHIDKIIPIGLIIFSLLVFILSIIKLKKKKVLVRNLSCIEKLSHIDTFCFDKTGTLTTNNLVLHKVISLNKKYDIEKILSIICKNCNDYSESIKVIGKKYKKQEEYKTFKKEYFDNYIKVSINGSKYLFGDASTIDPKLDISKYNDYQALLLRSESANIGLVLLQYELKDNLKDLITNLYNEDMNIKIISGDNAEILSSIAKKIGLKKIKCIDMSVNNTNMNHQIVEEYNVFCNVSPEQKKILINALKNNKKKVVTIGDGLNDLLALSISNSSITILNDKNEVYDVCDFIVLDNKLDCINNMVMESRRVINNMCKIIMLYLAKITYSFLMVVTYCILNKNYPLKLELITTLVVLIPSIVIMFYKDYKKPNIDFNRIVKKSNILSITLFIITICILLIKR